MQAVTTCVRHGERRTAEGQRRGSECIASGGAVKAMPVCSQTNVHTTALIYTHAVITFAYPLLQQRVS